MIYLFNYFFLIFIRIADKFGRGEILKKKILSSKVILEKKIPENHEFNFIQIGANDGISFDSLYNFVILRKSSGIVVEPVVNYFKELVNNYQNFPKIIKVNKAVHPSDKEKKIYKIRESKKSKYPDWVKGIASFNPDHHLKNGIDTIDIEEELVTSDTLMNIIFEFYKGKEIDYLQIDTEGYDFEVLKMLNLDVYRPSIVKYEFVNLKEEEILQSKKMLTDKSYFLFHEGNDIIGIDLKKIKLY